MSNGVPFMLLPWGLENLGGSLSRFVWNLQVLHDTAFLLDLWGKHVASAKLALANLLGQSAHD